MKSRTDQLQHIKANDIDVLVIGGGINGAVSAAVLSAAGIRTALVEARILPVLPAKTPPTSSGAGLNTWSHLNLVW